MSRRGPHDAVDREETSGVTMAPVPAKTLRLSELDESDRTAYFSVAALFERRKAIAQRGAPPMAPPAEPGNAGLSPSALPHDERAAAGPVPPKSSGLLEQLRQASPARKAILALLPLAICLVALAPLSEQMEPPPAPLGRAPTAPVPEQRAESAAAGLLAPTPPGPPASIPKGVTLERAASDALAGGDFPKALGLYRQLAQEHPDNAAYQQAALILARKLRERQP